MNRGSETSLYSHLTIKSTPGNYPGFFSSIRNSTLIKIFEEKTRLNYINEEEEKLTEDKEDMSQFNIYDDEDDSDHGQEEFDKSDMIWAKGREDSNQGNEFEGLNMEFEGSDVLEVIGEDIILEGEDADALLYGRPLKT